MQYTSQQNDWLVQPFRQPALVEEKDSQLILDNGLIRRTFATTPNFATVDGRSIDCVLHANAQINPCGLAMLYNPTRTVQRMTLKLPLYYTGLSEIAKIREKEGEPKRYKIDRYYNIEIPIEMEARSVSYLVIEPDLNPH